MTKREQVLAWLRRESDVPPEEAIYFTGQDRGIVAHVDTPVCERAIVKSGYDVFGVHWTETVSACHYTNGQKPIYDAIENWRDQVRIPNVERFDWASFQRDAERLDRKNKVIAVTNRVGAFERMTCLTTMEDCLVNLMEDPEAFGALVGAIADYKIALIEKIWSIARPDVINLHDDWGTAHSTFMHPELWRRVIRPHTQRIYDAIHGHGMVVCQHSCGRIDTLVSDMVEMGCDAWEAQPDAVDVRALREKYGDRLRILVPLPPVEQTAEEAEALRRTPGFTPYDTVPEFLYT